MENKKTTIHDIAESLGVTASTVSRALADHPRISKQTKEKVLAAAKEYNYQPNKTASKLRTGRGRSLGVIVPRINRSFFSNAIAGMESVTNPEGYTLMICQSNEDADAELQALQSLISNQVDGILISLSAGTKAVWHLHDAINEGTSVVQFDRVSEEVPVPRVVNDNVEGAHQLTKHLISLGFMKIFHFSGPLYINVYQERYEGYRTALKEAGIEFDNSWLFENVLTRDKGADQIQDIMRSANIPEAIFCASDFSALGARTALNTANPAAAETIEIAGFGNEPFTELMDPGMTTVDQNSMEMGRKAARLLIDTIEQQSSFLDNNEYIIRTKLIKR